MTNIDTEIVRTLKEQYDRIMIGTMDKFSNKILTDDTKPDVVREVFIYVIENILGWDPYQTQRYMTFELLKLMKLDTLYSHIPFPDELRPDIDIDYLACFLYPDIFTYNKRKRVLTAYEGSLSGGRQKLPKNFFTGEDGEANLMLCLDYKINTDPMLQSLIRSTHDLYAFFADTKKATAWLTANKLSDALLFHQRPLDVLHSYIKPSESEQKETDVYYHFFDFVERLDNEKRLWKETDEDDYYTPHPDI